jgi:hypothetical protein
MTPLILGVDSGTLAYVRAQSDRDLAQLVDATDGRR